MNESKKVKEAKYFLVQMKTNKSNRKDFEHNLSAFLTSSRTVFQYSFEECKKSTAGIAWYDKYLSSVPLIKFLKEKRDLNIHTEPVKTQAQYSIESTLSFHAGVAATVSDKDGNILSHSESGTKIPSPDTNKTKVDVDYKFRDWTGGEDVITLCESYIVDIEKFVQEGIKLNFITG